MKVLLAAALMVVLGTLATPASASPAGCGGEVPPASVGTWSCTFGDDFDGTSLDSSKWIAQRTDTTGYTNGKTACFTDSPGNVSVSNGSLQLTARREANQFTCKDPSGNFATQETSGMVSTYDRFSQTYGRFETRMRISSARVPGLQTSFWLWPSDGRYGSWPGSGEIDVAELYSQYADRAIPYVHYNPVAPDPNVTNTNCTIGNPDDFHTYALEWNATQLKMIYDGRTCLIDTWNSGSTRPFDQPFIIALTQALGVGTNNFNPTTTPLPATTTVDYVRAWQWQASGCTKARTARAKTARKRKRRLVKSCARKAPRKKAKQRRR
jgi:beta-glucanase (GH16 family)